MSGLLMPTWKGALTGGIWQAFDAMKGPKPPPQRADPTPPTLANPAIDAARNSQLDLGTNVFGRQQTVLTGGGGAPNAGTAIKKTILGG